MKKSPMTSLSSLLATEHQESYHQARVRVRRKKRRAVKKKVNQKLKELKDLLKFKIQIDKSKSYKRPRMST